MRGLGGGGGGVDWGQLAYSADYQSCRASNSLRNAVAFPVAASLPPKIASGGYFSEGEKRRPESRLLFAG